MKKNVMIVDDDPAIRETVKLLLEGGDYAVVQAPDGRACIEELRGGFRGVILMDIMMPGLTGWETIRAIVEEDLLQDNLVCMLTAKVSPGEDGAELESCVFDYLTKPFGEEHLVRCVENAAAFLEP